jgi:uncharacterized cupredoxin-like copper-binding protein
MKKYLALLAALLLAVGLAACGDSDDDTTAEEAPEESSAPADDEMDEEAMDEGPVLEVAAVDYGYEGLTATVTAGTRIALSNSSDTELHEFVAVRLPDEEERSVEELLQLPQAELEAALFPNVVSVILAAPGSSDAIVAVGSDTLDTPGRYAIICAIPTGADPNEYLTAAAESEEGPPQVDGGPPHFVNGMFAELTVE